MTASSNPRRGEVLRYAYALVGVLAVSAAIVTLALVISYSGDRKLRDQLEQYHLRSAMLTAEAALEAASLQQAITRRVGGEHPDEDPAEVRLSNRAIDSALASIGQTLEAIGRLHESWQEEAQSFSATLERGRRQHLELRDAWSRQSRSSGELSDRASALNLTLFQFERLHAIDAERLLDRIKQRERQVADRVVLAVAVVMLIAGLLVARILLLLRARLDEHERTERALIERERQLRQSSKMEALGSLVGGVAHDFNNLLTAILGHTEWIQGEMDPADPRQKMLEEVRKAGERASSLTRQLLAFSRQQPVQLKVIDANRLIADVDPMLRRLIREDITLELRLDPEACNVEADPVQMEQVLINLVVNARDAMPDGGVLTLETRDVEIAADPRHTDFPAGTYLQIGVEDTGCGIAPEILSRVFDPFFTTKESGKGTGLGLSTVHGIVTKIGGRVQAQSRPGVGTRFEVYLPRCGRPEKEEDVAAAVGPPDHGWETVLVAEDDPQIRELAARALRRRGYRVLEAGDGIEALRLCAEHPEPVHLILSDVVMPRMRGCAMVERALEFQPGARVLYMSGYAEEELLNRAASQAPVLTKPFKLPQLLALVRQELDRPRLEGVAAGGSD